MADESGFKKRGRKPSGKPPKAQTYRVIRVSPEIADALKELGGLYGYTTQKTFDLVCLETFGDKPGERFREILAARILKIASSQTGGS